MSMKVSLVKFTFIQKCTRSHKVNIPNTICKIIKKPKILTKDLLTEIDNLVEDIQIKGVLSQKQKINSIFAENVIPLLFEIKTSVEIENFSQNDLREKINFCLANTSDIVDIDSEYATFYSRIRVLRENILMRISGR